jgi:uncharacterized protein
VEIMLSDSEVRVIGSLIEKEVTTPEYYPMSLNALVNACNQKSNREPVVYYSEDLVESTLNSLREKRLARMVESGGRVPKFKQTFIEELKLNMRETAILTVLMLRGPQTTGEIRSRCGRLYEFQNLEEVDDTIRELNSRSDGPFIVKLERQTGMKERRCAHLLSGTPTLIEDNITENQEESKFIKLDEEIQNLKSEIEKLKNQFANFKKQFE